LTLFASAVTPRDRRRSGFTLVETLAALAIAAAVFAVFAQFAGWALRNWNRGEHTIAAMEMLTRGLGRLESDLALASPMAPPGSDGSVVYFNGDSNGLLFVAATGFGAGNRGLELLLISTVTENEETLLVRQRGAVTYPPAQLRDRVTLLRGRMQIRFSYRDHSGQTLPTWSRHADLPAAIGIDFLAAGQGPVFPATILLPLRTNLSIECLDSESDRRKPKRCPNTPRQARGANQIPQAQSNPTPQVQR